MEYYGGLDVSMKETFLCIVNSKGKVVFEQTLFTDPDGIDKAIGKSGYRLESVGLESGSLSGYLTRGLRSLGQPVVCIDARKMAAILAVTINKTDKNDARGIADAIRCHHYKEVYPKTAEEESLGVLLKSRNCLVSKMRDLKNTVRGFLKSDGIRLGTVSAKKFKSVVASHFDSVLPESREGILALLTCFESLREQIAVLEKKLMRLVKEDKDVQTLMTIPGIGPIVSMSFKAHLGDPHRFKKSSFVGAYFGLTPRQYSSGETVRQGRISKCGASHMRFLLVEAAVVLLTRVRKRCALRTRGLRLKAKNGLKKAATAVARRFAEIMHQMLLTREAFRYESTKQPRRMGQ